MPQEVSPRAGLAHGTTTTNQLTMYRDESYMLAAIRAGARAHLLYALRHGWASLDDASV